MEVSAAVLGDRQAEGRVWKLLTSRLEMPCGASCLSGDLLFTFACALPVYLQLNQILHSHGWSAMWPHSKKTESVSTDSGMSYHSENWGAYVIS